ncbi:MAG: transketolase C-terminal domain-containing protein [Nanoarchaeota archaeon]|nr:transketolase C-terminal domain-containing protein [Nanoarchaeota archaeon]
MGETSRDVIKRFSENHLKNNNGILLGQCLTAVGWVGHTIPELTENDGLVELSMADVAGGGIAVGTALSGRRPIYVVRYQGFQWFNAPMIVNYAAKSKDMWGIPCPLFIRSIAMDSSGRKGRAMGPVAGNNHHGIYFRMPGVPIAAPITPKEYQAVWDYFMSHDDPIYCSEHRRGWEVDFEIPDIVEKGADITLFPISSTRLNVIEALAELKELGIKCNVINLLWIKPFKLNNKERRIAESLKNSKFGGLVIDGDYINGVAKGMAYDLMHEYNSKVYALGLEERTAGFAPEKDNLPPTSKQIITKIKEIVKSSL